MADSIIGRLVYKIVGDDREYQKALRRSSRALETTGRQMQQIGQRLSIGLTVPLAVAGGAMLRAAIAAEETGAKFRTAFRGIDELADGAVTNLVDNYGLARDEAQALLSGTGDLLKGFGATADQALGLSSSVQSLAVDLASYNNVQGGAETASRAITAALLGEREQIKQLGVVIRQVDVDQRLAASGQAELTGQARLLAQAQATLELIMEQSGDAIGDYERKSGTAAQQLQQLQSRVRDLAVELGNELLPIFEDVLSTALELVHGFRDLDDEQKRNILRYAAVAAALGPVTGALGTATRAVNTLRLVFVALTANPVVLALLALTGAVAGLGVAIKRSINRQAADDMERFGDAAERAGVAASDYANAYADATVALDQQLAFGADLEESVRRIAHAYRVGLDAAVEIARTMPGLNDEHRELLDTLEAEAAQQAAQREDLAQLRSLQRERAEWARTEREQQEAITDELEEQSRAQVSWREYWDDVNERWRELGASIAIYERNLETIAAIENPERRRELLEQMEQMLALDVGMLTQEEQFPVTAEARRRVLAEIQRLLADMAETTQETVVANEDLAMIALGYTGQVARTTDELEDQHGIWANLIADANDFGDVLEAFGRAAMETWSGVFETIGQGIVLGADGFRLMKEVAKDLFVTILRALGEEFLVRSIASIFVNPPAAGGYAAASAAAFTAAGVVSAFGEGGRFYADQPQLIMVGDRPEYVDIRPVEHAVAPGASADSVHVHIEGPIFGYNDFARHVDRSMKLARRSGKVR